MYMYTCTCNPVCTCVCICIMYISTCIPSTSNLYKEFDGIGTGVLSQSSLKPLGCVHVHSTQLTYYMYQQFVSRCLAVFLQKNIFSLNMRVNCLTSHVRLYFSFWYRNFTKHFAFSEESNVKLKKLVLSRPSLATALSNASALNNNTSSPKVSWWPHHGSLCLLTRVKSSVRYLHIHVHVLQLCWLRRHFICVTMCVA